MSARIFTAGPWSVHKPFGKTWDDHGYKRICEVSRKGEALGIYAEASNMWQPNDGYVWGGDDAYLIAAGPELYEACKRAKALLVPEVVREPDRTIFWELVDAIAKAEGKS